MTAPFSHGAGAWQARQSFDNARAKFGLGEGTGADYNRWERSRKQFMENNGGSAEGWNADTYVKDTLQRSGAAPAPVTEAPPPAQSGDDSQTT